MSDTPKLLRLFDLYAANLLQGANAQAAIARDQFRAALAAQAEAHATEVRTLRNSERANEDQLCRIATRIGKDARAAPSSDPTIAGAAIAEIDRITAERDALRADAERYRWMRSHRSNGEWFRLAHYMDDGLDQIIDAARAQGGTPT
jgi:hypothetical protein